MFRDTRFLHLSELKAIDSPKTLATKALDVLINIMLISPNIIFYHVFSLFIYE